METKATDHLKEKVSDSIKLLKEMLLLIEYVDNVEALTDNLRNKIIQGNDLNNQELENE